MEVAGKQIGSVTVKVTPDTDGFSQRVKREIEAAMSDIEVKIDALLDDAARAQLRADTKEAAEAASNAAKVEVGIEIARNATAKLAGQMEAVIKATQESLEDLDVDTGVDESGFLRGLASLQAMADSADPTIDIDTEVDTDRALASLAGLFAAVEAVPSRIGIDVDAAALRAAALEAQAIRHALQDIDVDIGVDTTDMAASLAALEALTEMDRDIEFDLDIDTGSIIGDLAAVEAVAENLADIHIGFEVAAAEAIAEIAAVSAAAEAFVGSVDIPIRADSSRIWADMQAARARANAAAGEIVLRARMDRDGLLRTARGLASEAQSLANRMAVNIPVSIRGDRARREMARLSFYVEQQLQRLGKSTDVDVSRRLTAGIASANRRMRELGDEVDRNNRGGNILTRTLAGVGSSAASAANNLSLSGRSAIILLAVLTLLAPALAIVSGALLTLPSLLSLIAVPAAAIALSLDGIKKAAEVLKDEFEGLKKIMNESAQIQFGPVFGQLQSVFPMLNEFLPKVNEGLSNFAMGFANAVTSASGMGNIRNIIENVAETLTAAEPGVHSFTQAILNLFSKLSDRFPGMATIFNNLGLQFDQWIQKLTTLDEQGSTPLDRIVTSMKEITSGLANALGGLFTKGLEMLSDGDMGAKIKKFFEDLKVLIVESLPVFVDAFSAMVVNLNATATAVANVDNAVKSLKDTLDVFEGAATLGEHLKYLKTSLEVVGEEIKAWAGYFMEGLGAVFSFNPFQGLIDSLSTIKSSIEELLGLKDKLQDLPQVGSDKGEPGWDGTGKDGGGKLFGGLDEELGKLEEVPGKVAEVEGSIRGSFGGIAQEITTSFGTLAPALEGALAQVPAAANTAFAQVPLGAQTAVFEITAVFITGVNAWIQTLVYAGDQISAIVGSWPGLITGALGDLSGLLYDSGVQIANGLAAGITAGTGAAVAAAQLMAARVAAAARAALDINSPSKVFHEIGQFIDQGLANGIDAEAGKPATAMTTMIESLNVDTDTTLNDILGSVANMTNQMVEGIERTEGTVNINVNIGTINANSYEQVANQVAKSNDKIASSAKAAGKEQEKVYGKLDTEGKKASDELGAQTDEVEAEIARLELLADTTESKTVKANLEARIKQLEVQKKGLDYQKKAIEYENKYGEALEKAVQAEEQAALEAEQTGKTLMEKVEAGIRKGESGIREAVDDIVDAIGEEFNVEDLSGKWAEIWDDSEMKDLGSTVVDENKSQFYSDLGIGGTGAISQAINEIPQWIIQVNSVDEALTAKERETNKNALKYTGRS